MSGTPLGAMTAPLRAPNPARLRAPNPAPAGGRTLYAALLARRSVRQYEREPLDEDTLARVREIVAAVRPLEGGVLVRDVRFDVLFRDIAPDENPVEALGAYGRIVSPPHLLVPYLIGGSEAPIDGAAAQLADLGYRAQQIVVRLTTLGLGTCYVGCLPWEARARDYYGLGEDARLGATIAYGRPARGWGRRAFNAVARRLVGATNKRPAAELFYDATLRTDSQGGGWECPSAPPPELADLIEAARHAPSADNAQPWRFLWRDGALYLYVVRSSWRYRVGGSQDYRFYDGGICMANVSLAMEALGRAGRWELVDGAPGTPGSPGARPSAPACPEELQPLAVLRLG